MEEITVEYDKFQAETELAWGIVWNDIDEVLWFPKSQCNIKKKEQDITMPEWLYKIKLAPYD